MSVVRPAKILSFGLKPFRMLHSGVKIEKGAFNIRVLLSAPAIFSA